MPSFMKSGQLVLSMSEFRRAGGRISTCSCL